MPDYERAVIKPPVSQSRYLADADIPWEETEHQGFRLKRLYEDEEQGEKTWLMEVDPGASAPSHCHDEFEQFYILEGDIQDDNGDMRAGDFVCRPPGEMHWTTSAEGALVLLIYTNR